MTAEDDAAISNTELRLIPATARSSTPQATLLGLPVELRYNILTVLFVHEPLYITRGYNASTKRIKLPSTGSSLLKVSKQLRAEAEPVILVI